ncbi:fimbria/pilus periplasmic chaperone [Pseudochrobactrum asaccharolyticum]|uniref:fimbria/pilus periplasmic chaperone n=1 Tax=Pseudochrobactrum asaccharolyticum TaxID=354351 RepID=UPI00404306C6
MRVFKWTQTNDADRLTPATDVVVSPPATQVQLGKAYTIRVAHTDAPVQKSEESYLRSMCTAAVPLLI